MGGGDENEEQGKWGVDLIREMREDEEGQPGGN